MKDVLSNHTGTEVADLRNLAISLARDTIFGKQEMIHSSLSGKKNSNTATLDEKKINYIKTVVCSRFPVCLEKDLILFGHFVVDQSLSLVKYCILKPKESCKRTRMCIKM